MSSGYQTERSSCSISAGVAGCGFAWLPARWAAASATAGRSSSGTPRSRRRVTPPSRASSSTRAAGIRTADRLAEAADGFRRVARVEAERGRQADPVQRPVREPVAAADGLRHRVREREHRAAERGATVTRAAEQLRPRFEIRGRVDDAGSHSEISRAPASASSSAAGLWPCAYSASAQWASAFSAVPTVVSRGRSSVSCGVVDDPGRPRARAAAAHPPLGIS